MRSRNFLFSYGSCNFSQIFLLIILACYKQGIGLVGAYMILDLHSNSSTYFTPQVTAWQELSSVTLTQLDCSGRPLMSMSNSGGTFMKEYSSLPLHNSAYVTISLWFIREWYSSNDKIDITILDSSNTVFNTYSIVPVQSSTTWSYITCDSNSQRSLKDIVLNIRSSHTGNGLRLKFYYQNSVFFGLRDIKILLSNQTIATSSFCIKPPDSNFLSSLQCPCPLKKYGSSSGSCSPCHSTCATCFNSLPTGCLSCTPGHSFNGTMCVPCHSSCETCFGTSQYECLTCHDGGYFHLTTHSCHSSSCLSPLSPIPLENYFVCTCQDGNYCYDRNSTCIGNCPFPAFKSISRSYGQFCEFNCSMGLYFYNNGSCISDCEPYFIRRDEGGYIYCDYPCSTAKHLYWNGTCSNCTFPLVPNNSTGYRYCTYPCSPGQYLYWNGSCIANCNSPLRQDITEPGKFYCIYPCAITQFLDWNGVCLEACDYPYTTREEANRKYCNLPCPSNQYLFEIGSCLYSCEPPLISTFYRGVKICKRPCPSTQYFYTDEKLCRASCPKPYKFNTTDLSNSCELPVTGTEKKNVQQMNSVSNSANDATQGVVSISVVASTDPGGSSASALSKMLHYTRYINITYSAKLELMFKTKTLKTGFIPFLPSIYESLKENFPSSKVPSVFARYHIHSSFLVNFWDGFTSLGISIGIWIFLRILELMTFQIKSFTSPYRLFIKIRFIVQNFILTQFYNIYSDILMFFAIEIKATELNDLPLGISFVSSILLVGLGLLIIYIHMKILVDYQTLRNRISRKLAAQKVEQNKNSETLDKFNETYEGMKVLFFNFKDGSFFQQAFFLFLNIRNAFFALIIGLMFDYPMAQVIILTSFTVLTVFYLLVKRPFKEFINFLQQLLAEIILLVVNICLICLIDLDFSDRENEIDKRNTAGQVIIICNIVISFVAPFFGVAKVIVAIYTYIQLRRLGTRKNKSKKASKDEKLETASKVDQEKPSDLLNHTNISLDLDFTDSHLGPHRPSRSSQIRLFPNNRLYSDPYARAREFQAMRGAEKYENNSDHNHSMENTLPNITSTQLLKYPDNREKDTLFGYKESLFAGEGKRKMSNIRWH